MQYRLSTASAYSIYELYSQDWCAEDISAPPKDECDESWKSRLDDWTVEDVVRWSLTTTLSPEVATWLRQQEVTGRVLRSLDEAELTAMGLEPFGRRRQLLLCREEVLAEAAAKEKKANSPRTAPGAIQFQLEMARQDEDKSRSETSETYAKKVEKAIDWAALPTPARALSKRTRAEEFKDVNKETATSFTKTLQKKDVTPAADVKDVASTSKETEDGAQVQSAKITPKTWTLSTQPAASYTVSRCFYQSVMPVMPLRHGGSPLQRLPLASSIDTAGRAVSWMPWGSMQSPLSTVSTTFPTRTLSWIPVPRPLQVTPTHSWAPAAHRHCLCSNAFGPSVKTTRHAAFGSRPAYWITLPPRVIGYSVTVRPRIPTL